MSQWNLEWLNQNANRAYPFREDSRLTDSMGAIKVPTYLVVDLVFVVPAGVSTDYYLSQLIYGGTTLVLIFVDDTGAVITSITVDLNAHQQNRAYDLVGQGSFQDARGRIVIGDVSQLAGDVPQGSYVFDIGAAPLESRTVRPDLRSVRQLQIVNEDGIVSEPITGQVRLLAGQNIRLTYTPPTYITVPDPETGVPVTQVSVPASVQIDGISGENLNLPCPCDDGEQFSLPDPIRSINGVAADAGGNIQLESALDCLKITAAGNTISLEDSCTQECCGCVEMEFVMETLNLIQDTTNKLEQRTDLLAERLDTFFLNFVATVS